MKLTRTPLRDRPTARRALLREGKIEQREVPVVYWLDLGDAFAPYQMLAIYRLRVSKQWCVFEPVSGMTVCNFAGDVKHAGNYVTRALGFNALVGPVPDHYHHRIARFINKHYLRNEP